MVLPRMVYISDATELGTIYTKSELSALHDVCREYGLYLFLDGATPARRAGRGGKRIWPPADFAKYCDVFYIGGTKNGLLFGEALVITNDSLKPHFRNMIKQRGGMFAKGFLFGTQFKAYFEDDLWLTMARHARHAGAAHSESSGRKGLFPLRRLAHESGLSCPLSRADRAAEAELRVRAERARG